MKSRKGFTLIEILIVVAIIGILASVVLVGLRSSQVAARDTRRISDLRQIQSGLELYHRANNFYPLCGTVPATGVGADDFVAMATVDEDTDGTIDWQQDLNIAQIPDDGRANSATPVHYLYAVDCSTDQYTLGAEMEAANPTNGGVSPNPLSSATDFSCDPAGTKFNSTGATGIQVTGAPVYCVTL